MTCDEVRELLPEHLLWTLNGPHDLEVRRHLRGCAGCRAEMITLADGVAWFARAAHDRPPPDDLHDRVMTILDQEWQDSPDHASPVSKRGRRSFAAAAAVLAIVAALGWGAFQTHRADVASVAADSYHTLLSTLGGKEFRIGTLQPSGDQPVEGSVVLYDSHLGQSWGVVLIRAPGMTGTAQVTLASADGRTVDVHPLEFQPDGDAATWIVTSSDLTDFDRVTIVAEDDTALASAVIRVA